MPILGICCNSDVPGQQISFAHGHPAASVFSPHPSHRRFLRTGIPGKTLPQELRQILPKTLSRCPCWAYATLSPLQMEHAGYGGSSSRRWKKVVYGGMQQGYPDNYTDSSFLEGMVMNANLVQRDFWTTVLDSVAISQYLSVVAIVVSVWTYSLNLLLPARFLLFLDAFFLVAGFCILLLTIDAASTDFLRRSVLNLVFFVCGLYVMTPIFHTLTRSISSDSIWASTVCLLLVHLFFHDYNAQIPKSKIPNSASRSVLANVSLHASIVASVLIASRVPSRTLVFAIMLFSLEFFLLFPFVSRCISRCSVRLHLGFSCALVATAMCLLLPINCFALFLFLAAVVFITFVCPFWLIRIQEFKFEINGPWDEAKLCFDID